ncbi:MAG: hypothetical protein ACE5EQ_11455, partial [Phycisphaerae bacterium]
KDRVHSDPPVPTLLCPSGTDFAGLYWTENPFSVPPPLYWTENPFSVPPPWESLPMSLLLL